MKWLAQAPANIALIKYMGKNDSNNNIPSNSSLSYTLHDLLSFVEIENHTLNEDSWEPLELPGALPFQLSEKAQQRFLNHLSFLKKQFAFDGGLIVRSCNNFPMSTGLASSASSFAALTTCANRALAELCQKPELDDDTLAQLSRQGSGSSCRSFYSPWALWNDATTKALNFPYSNLIHHVILISETEKKIPSSEAHQRVTSSPLFATRPERAEQRLKVLMNALETQDWKNAYKIAWDEFHDLHELFITAKHPFRYRNASTEKALNYLQNYWEKEKDGPIITMDAGPNIHLLFRPDQSFMAEYLKSVLLQDYDVL